MIPIPYIYNPHVRRTHITLFLFGQTHIEWHNNITTICSTTMVLPCEWTYNIWLNHVWHNNHMQLHDGFAMWVNLQYMTEPCVICQAYDYAAPWWFCHVTKLTIYDRTMCDISTICSTTMVLPCEWTHIIWQNHVWHAKHMIMQHQDGFAMWANLQYMT